MRLFLPVVPLLAVAALACLPGAPQCEGDDDCDGKNVCTLDKATDKRVCAAPCAADQRCEDGYACVAVAEDDTLEGVCLDVKDERELGQRCTEDRECKSGACAGSGGDQACVATCAVGDACAEDLLCSLDGLRSVCVAPLDDKALGEACDSSRECVSGVCIIPPTLDSAVCAAPCADDGDCDAGVCGRLELGARACVDVLPDGAACEANAACAGGFCVEDRDGETKCASACTDGGCAEDFFCVPDQDGSDVCMPRLDDRPAGDACDVDRQCDSGLCRRFVAETDLGTLCADPCAAIEPVCAEGLVCWDGDDVDVCGPTP